MNRGGNEEKYDQGEERRAYRVKHHLHRPKSIQHKHGCLSHAL
jgi:hypothetical protein